jgi:biotin-[acetyl-CoA-carboxylase] ligase BirA-like protein
MKYARRLTFASIDSTNTYLKNHLSLPHLTLVRARFQTAGRGQFDRTWVADPNLNFLFSILWKKTIQFDTLKKIELALIDSVISFLKDDFGIEARHKLPNDIYIGSKKIAGFLIETVVKHDHVHSFIIGLGLNFNQLTFPNGIQATSVAIETQKTHHVDRNFERLLKKIKTFLPSI